MISLAGDAFAQAVVQWSAFGSGSYNLGANWGLGQVPGQNEIAYFGSMGANVSLDAPAAVGGIQFASFASSPYTLSTSSGSTLYLGQYGVESFASSNQQVGVPLVINSFRTPVTNQGTGTLTIGATGTTTTPVTINAGASILFGGAATSTGVVLGKLTGAGATIFNGGTWTLWQSNDYAGGTTINDGRVILNAGAALPASGALAIIAAAGKTATLDVAVGFGGANNSVPNTVTLGAVRLGGSDYSSRPEISIASGQLILAGDVTFEAFNKPNRGLITSASGAGSLSLSGTRTFVVQDSPVAGTDLLIDARITGGGLVKAGAGTLQLSSTQNAYTGGTVVNQGTLLVTSTGAIPSGSAVSVASSGGDAVLSIANNASVTVSSLTLGAQSGGINARNIVEFTGSSSFLAFSQGGSITVYGSGADVGARIGNPYIGTVPNGSLDVGSGGIVTIDVRRNNSGAIWSLDLVVTTALSGGSAIQKTGTGAMLLEGSGSLLTGTLNVNQGAVLFGNGFSPAGGTNAGGGVIVASGAVIGAGARASASTGEVVLSKAVTLNSGAQLGTWDLDQGIRLNLAGTVNLQPAANSTSVTLALGGYEGSVISGTVNATAPGSSLSLVNALAGHRGLLAVRTAVGANVGSISVDGAGLILSALPSNATTSLNATGGGYLGVAPAVVKGATPSVQAVVDRVGSNKSTFSGTFGFDSFADATTPQIFSDNVSFAGFGTGLTLGSMTSAILTGVITPPGSEYAFGNGGGALILRGNATLADGSGGGPRSLSVDSSSATNDNALALVLQTTNSFTGGVRVKNSAVIFDAAGALPAGVRPMNIQAGAYVGFSEAAGMSGPGGFRSLLSPSNFTSLTIDSTAVLGIDSSAFIADKIINSALTPFSTRYLADRLDFSQLTPIGFGSATRATLLGTLVGPVTGNSRSLRLLGVEGGVLEVRSRIADANAASLTVGGNSLINADGKVVLAGQNTYSGGTTLLSGTLVAASTQRLSRNGTLVSGPLGLGAISVPADAHSPTLTAAAFSTVTVPNAFLLGSRLSVGAFDYSPGTSMSSLTLAGTIGNLSAGSTGGLDIYNDVTLRGTNTFSGGVYLYNGVIYLGSSSGSAGGPLGTGTFKVSPVPGSYNVGLAALGTQSVSNPIIFEFSSSNRFSVYGTGSLTLAGPLTLSSPVEFYVGSQPLYLTGQISGAGSLGTYYGSGGTLVVNPTGGANTFTGGVSNYSGRIVFATPAAIPAGAVLAPGYDGYTGFASGNGAASFAGDFLTRFDRVATSGTIGLDTLINGKLAVSPTQGTPNLFSDQIDLRGFSPSVMIGSASTARLSGSITPAYNTYSFGGGGGWLEVSSALVDIPPGGSTLSVSAPSTSSSAAPLTVRLNSGANTFTGGGEASGAALIFAPGTMPASGTFTVRNGGYIGSETVTDAFLGRLALGSSSVMVGFDTAPGGTVASITGSIDLTRLQNSSGLTAPKVLLGTASQATLSGTITLRPEDPVYRFGAYKGGLLTVASPLAGGSVQIGDSSNVAFHTNPINPSSISTVTLSGSNTYTGGTSLLSGLLLLGNANALGTGRLTISKPLGNYGGIQIVPMLGSAVEGLSIGNPVTLSGADLSLVGDKSFKMAGDISGTGGVSKTGTGTVTLTGVNTLTGVSVEQGTLVLEPASPSELRSVSFPVGSAGTVRLLNSFTLGSVSGESSSARIEVAAGKMLTINPVASSTATTGSTTSNYPPAVFAGTFAPVASGGAFELVFSGTVAANTTVPQLRLTGQSTYTGTTRIRPGIDLIAADDAAFGQSSVILEGGRLALASGVSVTNALTLNSGVLAGEGGVVTATALGVGPGVQLQPGFDLAGTLSFVAATTGQTALSLLGGGGYRWKIGDATSPGGEWDRINVSGGVSVTATAAAPFTVQMAPVGALGLLSGVIAGFDPAQAYAWPILSASSITGFTPGAFVVDSSAFATLAADYKFSVGLVADSLGSSLVLNYNPAAVPEPSTWVMLLSGAAAGAVWLRRRRRT
ncbi:MAG: autotransporter-associated beta strand repeat-containing protein [Opitutaceae bacterium]